MKEFYIDGYAPSLLPDGYDFKLVWSDEFDGDTLDASKWDYRLSMMGKMHPAWTDKGVKVENGCAVFSIFEEDGRIVSSQLQTGYNFLDAPIESVETDENILQWQVGKLRESKFTHRYGYYECRCKLQRLPGWWSAFWIQSPIIGSSLDTGVSGIEVDIMESFSPGKIDPHVLHYNGYSVDHKSKIVGKGKTDVSLDEFHTIGVLWEEDGYTFFVDGVQDGEKVTDPVSHTPQFILISTEVDGYRTKERTATAEAIAAAKAGDTFKVDYVRVFDFRE